jgi:hypothetical protein
MDVCSSIFASADTQIREEGEGATPIRAKKTRRKVKEGGTHHVNCTD